MNLLSAEQILFWILTSIVVTFLMTRLNLHLRGVWHVYVKGHILRHLFTGTFLVIPTGFMLAFGLHHKWSMILTLMIFGIGSGLILDEIVYLMATNRTDADYTSRRSLHGGIWLTLIGVIALLSIYLSLR